MPQERLKILLIEHDPGFARMVGEMLSQARELAADMKSAPDLNSGLTALKGDHFDVVVLDAYVPDGAGLANVSLVRAQAPRLPIIVAGEPNDEAIALESAGVDAIIASGFEAGGHRPSFLASAESSTIGTFVLLQLIKEKVKTPIIAAGGIANGKGVAASLALGADAAQIGTAFLVCDESNATAIHRQMLFSTEAKYTSLSRAFTGRLGRGIASRIGKDMVNQEKNFLPFPLQTKFMSQIKVAAMEQEQWDMILFWGGQIAPILKHTKASELMKSILEETTAYFDRLNA